MVDAPSTGRWSSPASFPASVNGENPVVAMSPNGHVIVVWERNHRIYAAR